MRRHQEDACDASTRRCLSLLAVTGAVFHCVDAFAEAKAGVSTERNSLLGFDRHAQRPTKGSRND